jgi:hypothetical protein
MIGCTLAVLLALGAPAAEEVVSDDWYAQFDAQGKTGWSHRRLLRTTVDGKAAWITESESEARPVRTSTRIVEDGEGRVLSYRTSVDIGMKGGPQVREGRVEKGVVRAVEDGKARQVPYPAGALGPAAIDRAVAANLKPGAAGEVLRFQTIDAKAGVLRWTVAAQTELTDVLGRHLWLTRVERTDETGIPEVSLVGPGNREFAGSINLGTIRWLLAEEVVAKSDREPAALVAAGVVAPDRAIPPRPARAVYRLSRKGTAPLALPEGRWQRVVAKGDANMVDVEVTFAEPPSGTAVARPQLNRKDLARYLAAAPFLETAHPRLQAMAAEAVGGLINSLRTARMIELGVHDYLAPAPAGTGFPTACEAISSATGDSKAAAALAAGLCRAAGIPSRVVGGFAYREGKPVGAFEARVWVEAHVAEDVWFPLDPLRMDGTRPVKGVDDLEGHGGFDATHIAVIVSDLATDRPFTDIVKPVLDFMDGLTIAVIEPK